MNITVFDLREPQPPSNKKSLTLEMVHNDGYGNNLNFREHDTFSETIIEDKVGEYNRLSGESNSADKLIKQYRIKTMGLIRSSRLNHLEKSIYKTNRKLHKLQESLQ